MHAVTHIFENICKHLLYMYIYINYNEFHMWWTCVPSPSLDKEASLNSQTLPGCRQRRRSETGYSSSCWRTMGNAGTKTPTTVESNYCRKLQRKCYWKLQRKCYWRLAITEYYTNMDVQPSCIWWSGMLISNANNLFGHVLSTQEMAKNQLSLVWYIYIIPFGLRHYIWTSSQPVRMRSSNLAHEPLMYSKFMPFSILFPWEFPWL